ncbi:unnamed protein product, partial [marine sediment metagenome]
GRQAGAPYALAHLKKNHKISVFSLRTGLLADSRSY